METIRWLAAAGMALALIFPVPAAARNVEGEDNAVEIPADPGFEHPLGAPERISPGEPPEPVEAAPGSLGPAERIRLDELERSFMAGEITETEYDMEKEALIRDAGIEI